MGRHAPPGLGVGSGSWERLRRGREIVSQEGFCVRFCTNASVSVHMSIRGNVGVLVGPSAIGGVSTGTLAMGSEPATRSSDQGSGWVAIRGRVG